MTPKKRLLNTLKGLPVDRIPVYTQIPFGVSSEGFEPAAFHGYEDYDNWRKHDAEYWKLVKRMEAECDNFFVYRPDGMSFEKLLFSPEISKRINTIQKENKIVNTVTVETPAGSLQSISVCQPGTGHTWLLKHYCQTTEDIKMLLSLPWEAGEVCADDYFSIEKNLGDKGVFWITIPSPILMVCRLFEPIEFLMLVRTERKLISELMDIFSERIYQRLQQILELGLGPIIRFGGAEHATPPLLSPEDFDHLVYKYDKPLMDICKNKGRFIAVHCHGNIRHALKRFLEMGVDQTDPVEVIPDGEISLEEAKKISGDKITLTGNIQMRELYEGDPGYIEKRVKHIIEKGSPGRLIVSTTGTPLEKITPRLYENYNCLIDSALKYGATG